MPVTDKQHDLRNKGVGCSDIMSVLNINPFGGNAIDVYYKKIGMVPRMPPNEAMRFGLVTEDAWLDEFARVMNRPIRKNQRRVSKKYPWLRASHDALMADVVDEGVQMKSVGAQSDPSSYGAEMSGDIPLYYNVQVQGEMIVSNLRLVWVPVIFLGTRAFKIYRVERDEELCGQIIDETRKFWQNHVEKRIPPSMLPSEETLKRMERRQNDETPIPLSDSVLAMIEAEKELGKVLRDAEKKHKSLKQQIIAALGEGTHGRTSDGRLVTYKSQLGQWAWDKDRMLSDGIDWSQYASQSTRRTLRIGKPRRLEAEDLDI